MAREKIQRRRQCFKVINFRSVVGSDFYVPTIFLRTEQGVFSSIWAGNVLVDFLPLGFRNIIPELVHIGSQIFALRRFLHGFWRLALPS